MIAKQAVAAAAWLEATDIRTNPVQANRKRTPSAHQTRRAFYLAGVVDPPITSSAKPPLTKRQSSHRNSGSL